MIELTESGRHRISAAIAAAQAGDFKLERKDGYYVISAATVLTCCWCHAEEAKAQFIEHCENALSGELRMVLSCFGSTRLIALKGYKPTVAIIRSDYSTPAQRALERLGQRLNNG